MSEQKNILVIDDEEFIRKSLMEYLEDFEYHVETTESAEKGIEKLTEKKFDVVIVDIRLPGLNGSDFIEKIYKISPQTKFIIHTGSIDFVIPKELKTLGISEDDVILKPEPNMKVFIQKIEES